MITVGIDPGKKGGMAWGDGTPGRISCAKTPETVEEMASLLRIIKPDKAALEKVGGFIGHAQPGSAMFEFGRSYGELRGALAAFGIPCTLLTPQAWQKTMKLGNSKGMSKTSWKNELKDKAMKLYPGVKITLATSDAVLIYHAAVFGSQPHNYTTHSDELGF